MLRSQVYFTNTLSFCFCIVHRRSTEDTDTPFIYSKKTFNLIPPKRRQFCQKKPLQVPCFGQPNKRREGMKKKGARGRDFGRKKLLCTTEEGGNVSTTTGMTSSKNRKNRATESIMDPLVYYWTNQLFKSWNINCLFYTDYASL